MKTFALHLSNNDIKVLRDGDRILPGDRFADEIHDWIARATSACVFLSEHSLASEWVAREIDACLKRQASDSAFAIIPVLLDNSTPPPKLQDRVFVDGRHGVEKGLPGLLSVIQSAEQAAAQGRANPWGTSYFDFGVHGEIDGSRYRLELDVVSYDNNETYSILSQFVFNGLVENVWERLGFEDPKPLQNHLLKTCAEAFAEKPALTTVSTHQVRRGRFPLADENGQQLFEVAVRTSILGPGPKGVVAFNSGALLIQICNSLGIALEGDIQSLGSLGGPLATAAGGPENG